MAGITKNWMKYGFIGTCVVFSPWLSAKDFCYSPYEAENRLVYVQLCTHSRKNPEHDYFLVVRAKPALKERVRVSVSCKANGLLRVAFKDAWRQVADYDIFRSEKNQGKPPAARARLVSPDEPEAVIATLYNFKTMQLDCRIRDIKRGKSRTLRVSATAMRQETSYCRECCARAACGNEQADMPRVDF